ncbi:TPM domain-containing protein [Hymenobacter guriensis]|uniref:TPM domain-containing protein n=1 Tax=Hymenobacter guriensis TaxID=2793065 RepID=A0ABS0L5G6_9BACT|nr:TPM domain-containing protein [Hymenobacter guriensis]MBG8554597.1 TPM domain-containing protein [Hymenobacter guriensis]
MAPALLLRSFLLKALVVLALGSSISHQATAQADYLTTIPDPKTLEESYVSDPDHLLQPATVRDLNAILRPLDQSGRAHIDVVLTRSIGEEVPKTAATALFNRWKIGDKTKNNGLLMLVVEDQRRVEFETGYGLEADLPDVICFRIQQRYMLPHLRTHNYDAAVRAGVAALLRQLATGRLEPADSAAVLAGEPVQAFTDDATHLIEEYQPDPNAWSELEGVGMVAALVFMVVCVLVLGFRIKKPAANYWVLFLGVLLIAGLVLATVVLDWAVPPLLLIGLCYAWPGLYLHGYLRKVNQLLASSYADKSRHARYQFLSETHYGLGWLRFLFPLGMAFYWPRHRQRLAALRDEAYACPVCATPMHRLSETQDDAALQPGQAAEERIQSIDYDVWQCPACRHQLTLDYANLGSDAEACPKCHHRTLEPQPDEEVQAATTSHGGWGWHVHTCAFCQHVKKEKYTTSQLSSSSGSSSGSSFSGGSSSSSSSSGGSSGGGGAGSSW